MGTGEQPQDWSALIAPPELGFGNLGHLLRDLVTVVDLATGRVVLANSAAESLLDWRPDELVGCSFEEFVPPEQRDDLRQVWLQVRESGTLRLVHPERPVEMTLRTRAGDTRTVEVTASLVTANGRQYVVSVAHDVSERARVQRALAASETRFRALADTAPIAIAVMDLAGALLYVNRAGAHLFGLADPTIGVGLSFDSLVVPEDRGRVEALRRGQEQPEAGEPVELHVARPDGETSRLATRSAPLQSADGQRAGTICVCWDVTGVKDRDRRRTSLFRAARRFALESDPERLLQVVLEETVAALNGTYAVVRLWDDAAGGLVVRASTLPAGAPRDVVEPGDGVTGETWLSRQPAAHYPPRQSGASAGVAGALSVPLRHEGQPIGTLAVATLQADRRFSDADIGVLTILADLATAALVGLENARLHGAILAARTAQHQVNNHLGLTVCYSELLANDPDLSSHLRGIAMDALESAQQAASMLRDLRELTRIEVWQPRASTSAAESRNAEL